MLNCCYCCCCFGFCFLLFFTSLSLSLSLRRSLSPWNLLRIGVFFTPHSTLQLFIQLKSASLPHSSLHCSIHGFACKQLFIRKIPLNENECWLNAIFVESTLDAVHVSFVIIVVGCWQIGKRGNHLNIETTSSSNSMIPSRWISRDFPYSHHQFDYNRFEAVSGTLIKCLCIEAAAAAAAAIVLESVLDVSDA